MSRHQQAIDLPPLPASQVFVDSDGDAHGAFIPSGDLYTADQMRAAMRAAILTDRSRSAAPVAVPDTQNLRPRDTLILTARQLHNALEFIAPDFPLDDDQAEASASIAWCETRKMLDDDGNEYDEPAGHWCWLTDYPEEGGIPLLDDQAWHAGNSSEQVGTPYHEPLRLFNEALDKLAALAAPPGLAPLVAGAGEVL